MLIKYSTFWYVSILLSFLVTLYSYNLMSFIKFLILSFFSGIWIVLKEYVLLSSDKLLLIFNELIIKCENSINQVESNTMPLSNFTVLLWLQTYSPLDSALFM